MSVPTRSEAFSLLLHHVRMCQDQASMMAHLHNTEGNDRDRALARGWLKMEDQFRLIAKAVTNLAMGHLQ